MESFTYYLPAPVPSKKNSRTTNKSTGRSFVSKRFSEWHECALFSIFDQCRPAKPFTKVEIKISLVFSDKHVRDADNATSSIFDLLKDARIIKDDKWENVPDHFVHAEYGPEMKCTVEVTPK